MMDATAIRARLRGTCLQSAAQLKDKAAAENMSNTKAGKMLGILGCILEGLDSDSFGIDGLHRIAKKQGWTIAADLALLYIAVRRDEADRDRELGIGHMSGQSRRTAAATYQRFVTNPPAPKIDEEA